MSEEAPQHLMGSEADEGVSGVYDSRYKEIWIDPDPSSERTPGGGKRSAAATISHEIGHSRLGHTPSNLSPGRDRQQVEEFFEPLTDFVRALEREGHKGIETNRWEIVRSFVQELETRILQETQGYKQDPGDTFADYFEEIYALQMEEFSRYKNPIEKLIPIEAAKQAINNLVKKGFISKKVSFQYYTKINKIISKYR